jgi:thiol-disulfide isomerase/thioredoxin
VKVKIFVVILTLGINFPVYAINLPLTHIDGSEQNINDFKGNWIVVNFWATWCPPCIAEMPDLQSFHDKHSGNGAMVIGINVENLSSKQILSFLDTYSITYPVYRGANLMNSELGSVPGLPTTFLVSPLGIVEARQVGVVTGEMIENFIEKWEAKQSVQ